VNSVEPTKSFGGRKTVEGARLRVKSGLCTVVEAESGEKVVFEVVYVVVVFVGVLLVTVVMVVFVGAVVVDVEFALTVVVRELVVLLIGDEVEDDTTGLVLVEVVLNFSQLPPLVIAM